MSLSNFRYDIWSYYLFKTWDIIKTLNALWFVNSRHFEDQIKLLCWNFSKNNKNRFNFVFIWESGEIFFDRRTQVKIRAQTLLSRIKLKVDRFPIFLDQKNHKCAYQFCINPVHPVCTNPGRTEWNKISVEK